MSNDLNQCCFIGRLGNDPSVKYTQSGKAVTSFSIAVGWKTADKEGVEWVPVTAFDKLGEICGEYLRKGSQVFISGRFKTEKYEKDGQDRYSTKIIADRMQMLGSRSDSQQQAAGAPQRKRPQPATAAPADEFQDDDLGDIPFATNRGTF